MRFGNTRGMGGNSLANALRRSRSMPGNPAKMMEMARQDRMPQQFTMPQPSQMPAQMGMPEPGNTMQPMPQPGMGADIAEAPMPIRQAMPMPQPQPMPSQFGSPPPGDNFGGPPMEMVAQRGGGGGKSQKAPSPVNSAGMMSSRLRRPGPISTDNSF